MNISAKTLFGTFCAVIVTLFVAVCASSAGTIKITNTDVPAAGSTVTNHGNVGFVTDGFIEGVYLDFQDAGNITTATVSIVTVGGVGAPPSRTILSKASITADTYFAVRLSPSDTAGAAITANIDARLPLSQDKISVTITAPYPATTLT